MNKTDRHVEGLGEVSIRAKDLETRYKFYEEVVGLEVLRRDESFVFFKIAEGYGGHTQNLALFEGDELSFIETKSPELSEEKTTLHHIGLYLALEDFESEKIRLAGPGLKVNATVHEWLHVISPTPKGICRSLSLTMRRYDR